jgi:hypothetical protein
VACELQISLNAGPLLLLFLSFGISPMGASESKEGMCGGECDIERVCDTKKCDRIVTVGKVRGVEASGMRDRSPRNLQKQQQQQQQQQHAHPQQQANQEIPNNVLAMESNGHEAKTCRLVPQIPPCMQMTHQQRTNGSKVTSWPFFHRQTTAEHP